MLPYGVGVLLAAGNAKDQAHGAAPALPRGARDPLPVVSQALRPQSGRQAGGQRPSGLPISHS